MKIYHMVLMLSVLFLSACDIDTSEVRTATDYRKQPFSYQKPGAVINLENAQVNLEVSGAQYAIDPGLISGYNSGDLELSVSASDGLYIVGGDTNPTMALTKGKMSCPYTVAAAKPGRYYLYINAKATINGAVRTRALTFIVQVGDEAEKDNGSDVLSSEKASGSGEIVVPMTAQEEIIQH